jgi:hypothetical protein
MKNVGGIDRIIRITVGLALITYAAVTGSTWAYLGILPLATGLIGWCPAYCPLKMSTCKSGGTCSAERK